jgi:DNA-binding transcriptional regulator YdaS (Cro superfamily)
MRFRDLLRDELDRRRARNRRYSLRSFARFLGVDHSTLSQIIRGRRRLTPRTIGPMGERLGLAANVLRECAAGENDAVVLRVVTRASFRPDVRWIAVRTGLTIDDINISLHRLLHGRALAMVSRDSWISER